jgi:cell division control protein 42
LAQQIAAFDYIECSAIQCEGIKDVFDKAIVRAVKPPAKKGCEVY